MLQISWMTVVVAVVVVLMFFCYLLMQIFFLKKTNEQLDESKRDVEQTYQKHLKALLTKNENVFLACSSNLSAGMLEEVYSADEFIGVKFGVQSDFDLLMGEISNHVQPIHRKEEYLEKFSREALLDAFHKGTKMVSMTFNCMRGNEACWARAVAEMVLRPSTKEIDAVFYAEDVTLDRVNALTLECAATHDYDNLNFIFTGSMRYGSYSWIDSGHFRMFDNYQKDLKEWMERSTLENQEEVEKALSWNTIIENLNRQGIYTYYFTVFQPDGTRRRKKMQYIYLDERAGLVFCSQTDITDIYEIETKQKQALRQALEEANVANAAKTDFLSRMSHDMRTPMNAIIGITALAIEDVNDPVRMEQNLTKINTASHFLLGLINDILDMTKIEEGSVELVKEPYYYSDFLGNLRTMFEPLCQKNGVIFELEEEKERPPILVDKIRFNQIFFNLLSNAIKFTPEGGKVSFREEYTQIQDNIYSTQFVVEDTGIGMSQEFQEKMFQPFAREETGMASKVQGTGLGLSITKNLVELMGGRMQVQSRIGEGTKISISLSFETAVEDYEQRSNMENEISENCLIGKRVLLVEDHPLNLEIARRILEKKKMVVYCAENGKIAVEKFASSEENFFDMVLMDIRMPVMSGLEATAAIRSLDREDAKNVFIVAMTANAYAEDVAQSKEAGMDMHLSKPIEPNILYDVLMNYFGQGIRNPLRQKN